MDTLFESPVDLQYPLRYGETMKALLDKGQST